MYTLQFCSHSIAVLHRLHRNSTNTPVSRPPQLDADYGEPVDATCAETSPGVFERSWTKVNVRVDCANWAAATITPA